MAQRLLLNIVNRRKGKMAATSIRQPVLTGDQGQGGEAETNRSSESCTNSPQTVFGRRAADCIRMFAVLSGVVQFSDSDREHVHAFAHNMLQTFPGLREELPAAVVQAIDGHRIPKS